MMPLYPSLPSRKRGNIGNDFAEIAADEMARKRKSSELPADADEAQTSGRDDVSPTKPQPMQSKSLDQTLPIDRALERLCRNARIDLPRGPAEASTIPGQIPYQILARYRFLWYQDRPALQGAVNAFFESLALLPPLEPIFRSQERDRKLNLLLDKLSTPALEKATQLRTPNTPKTQKFGSNHVTKTAEREASPPLSPTPSQKNGAGPAFKITKLPQAQAINNDMRSSTVPRKPFAVVSFESTMTQKKSFSSLTTGSERTVDTALTSFSMEDVQRPSDFGSIVPTEFLEDALSQMQRPRESDAMTSASECWGSSLNTTDWDGVENVVDSQWSSQIERMQRMLDIDIDAAPAADRVDIAGASRLESAVDVTPRARVRAKHIEWRERRSPPHAVCRTNKAKDPKDEELMIGTNANLETTSPNAEHLAGRQGPLRMHFTPARNFVQLQIPDSFNKLAFHIQWEAHRILQIGSLSLDELASQWQPQTLERLYDIAANHKLRFRGGYTSSETPKFEEVTMNGELHFARSSTGPIFDMALQAPKQEVSCDLQRRYGADRVLYVSLPNIFRPPQQHSGRDIENKFREMAAKPQSFLGRQWIMYTLQPNKMNSKSSKPDSREPGTHRIVFLAIDDMNVADVFAYLLPFQENRNQLASKLYTRLDLFVSRTFVGIQFDESDVDYQAKDQLATDEVEDDPHQDPALQQDFYDAFVPGKEMSDGCAEISFYAFWKINEQLGGDLRSAFQARIGGAKGVWYKAREDYASFGVGKPPGPLIKLVQSQIKVQRKDFRSVDPDCLKFNVVKPNSYARPSLLHIGFMPILLDRGVPRQIMLDVVRTQIKAEVDECEAAILNPDPLVFREWMTSRNELFEERNRLKDGGIDTIAGFPIRREERIIRMLESGFIPTESPFLARDVNELAKQIFDLKRRNFKIRLGRSTTLMGIADPYGCLKPGEVHVSFSAAFRDPVTKVQFQRLDMDGLVARNPAMAAWDIQRVHFVCRPELEHLTDLVIFPSRGTRPLASKLQGGDYDGDTFWICWDKKLVHCFKNAPAPWANEDGVASPFSVPSAEQLGITRRTEKLCDFVQDPGSLHQWCGWLGEMARARLEPNLLGVVTKLHERLIYATGDINSHQAKQLVYLHDYLVDADKQGYEFDYPALDRFRKAIKLPTDLPDPKYWKYTVVDDDNDPEKQQTTYTILKRGPGAACKNENIIDEAYFDVAEPLVHQCLERVEEALNFEPQNDEDLTRFYDQTWNSASPDSIIRTELQTLKARLQDVRSLWSEIYTSSTWFDLLTQVRVKYDEIQPQGLEHPTVVEWLRRQGNGPTTWDKLKACAFAKLFQKRGRYPGKLIFNIAGHELCEVKAQEAGMTRLLLDTQYRRLKPRKTKKIEVRDEYDCAAGGMEAPDRQLDEMDDEAEPTNYY